MFASGRYRLWWHLFRPRSKLGFRGPEMAPNDSDPSFDTSRPFLHKDTVKDRHFFRPRSTFGFRDSEMAPNGSDPWFDTNWPILHENVKPTNICFNQGPNLDFEVRKWLQWLWPMMWYKLIILTQRCCKGPALFSTKVQTWISRCENCYKWSRPLVEEIQND